ncbi:Purine nucleoside phosphorylase [Candidatus Tiddalikarchaeum anstoanum]|nr:Purine nucleoside phosphorylase [Candidatus Tiddalikarchaeum anstoanum]
MITPHLHVSEKDINEYVLIMGDPGRVERSSLMLKNPKKVSENRGFVVYNGEYKGVPVTLASTGIGIPSAAIVIEELVQCGAKTIIRVGSGGVTKKEIDTGDIVISTGVCKEEKSSLSYAPEGFAAVPNFEVLKALIDSAKESKKKFFYGITMCCDAFYTKNHRDLMEKWGEMGVIGSDMESSILFTLGEIKGFRVGFIFYAGMNIAKKETSKDIIKQEKQRLEGEKNTIIIALDAIKKLKEVNG